MYIEVKKRTNREVAKAREETVKDWNQKLETKEAISVHIITYLTTFLYFILETDLIWHSNSSVFVFDKMLPQLHNNHNLWDIHVRPIKRNVADVENVI